MALVMWSGCWGLVGVAGKLGVSGFSWPSYPVAFFTLLSVNPRLLSPVFVT